MRIELNTLKDISSFTKLMQTIIKGMSLKEVEEIARDKTHAKHEAVKEYANYSLLLINILTDKEIEQFGDVKIESPQFNEVLERAASALTSNEDYLESFDTALPLLEHPKLLTQIWLNSFSEEEIDTMLRNSCELGDTKTLERLLKAGVNVNTEDKLKCTPLFTAVENQQLDAVQVLIDNGANVNHKNAEGEAPLHAAVITGDIDIVETLLNKGADINIKNASSKAPIKSLLHACELLTDTKNLKDDFDIRDKELSQITKEQVKKYKEILKYLTRKLERADKSKKESTPTLVLT